MLKVSFPAPYFEHEYKAQPDHIVCKLFLSFVTYFIFSTSSWSWGKRLVAFCSEDKGMGQLTKCWFLNPSSWHRLFQHLRRSQRRWGCILFVDNDSLAGLNHVNDVVEMMFHYIGLLRREAPQPWIYEELREMGEMKFTFKVFLLKNFYFHYHFFRTKRVPTIWLQTFLQHCKGYLLRTLCPIPCWCRNTNRSCVRNWSTVFGRTICTSKS